MMRKWQTTVRVTPRETKLLVTAPEGDLLKARLDTHPCHPRALLTLLEGRIRPTVRTYCDARLHGQ